MKKLLIGLLALGSISTFAFHPDDGQRLINIGVGTQLRVLKDININPNKERALIGGSCSIRLVQVKSYDRVLSAESVLTVTGTIESPESDILFVDNKNIRYVSCAFQSKYIKPSIRTLKEDAKETLEVILADPTKI